MKRGGTNEPSRVAPVVERNIQTLIVQRQTEEANLSWHERLAGLISQFAGSLAFLLLHVAIFGFWVVVNCELISGVPRFDPTLVKLAVTVSVETVFLSTFILITQRRMMAQADRRADLNLQISLLAEYEITRLITITRAMAKAMNIEEGREPELEDLARDIAPEQLLQTMDEQERRVRERSP
jgi:uncharacterized membrane protein